MGVGGWGIIAYFGVYATFETNMAERSSKTTKLIQTVHDRTKLNTSQISSTVDESTISPLINQPRLQTYFSGGRITQATRSVTMQPALAMWPQHHQSYAYQIASGDYGQPHWRTLNYQSKFQSFKSHVHVIITRQWVLCGFWIWPQIWRKSRAATARRLRIFITCICHQCHFTL